MTNWVHQVLEFDGSVADLAVDMLAELDLESQSGPTS